MNIISGIRNSGFLAQSAYSADIANKDALGRVIDTTYLTAHQDLSNYATKDDLSAYTERTDFNAAIESIDSGKLDVSSFSSVSSNFLTAVPEGYATEDWVTSQGYLTAHQSLDGLMSASLLEQSGGLITGYNGTAFAGQGGGVTGDYELSAGSGISIVDYPLEQKTVISVTAQGGNPEVEQAVIDNSATWNDVTAKADTTAIPSLDGYATEDWVTAQGYLTTSYNPEFAYHDTAISSIDNSGLYDTSAHARINTLAGRISDLSSNKLDTSAFSDVSGTFLTAHQDLSNYQTTAGMTAYQTTAGMSNYATTGDLDYVSGVVGNVESLLASL